MEIIDNRKKVTRFEDLKPKEVFLNQDRKIYMKISLTKLQSFCSGTPIDVNAVILDNNSCDILSSLVYFHPTAIVEVVKAKIVLED